MYGSPPPPQKSQKKTTVKEVPQMVKGFFARYFYIFKLVWEANPFVLIVMSLMTLFNGLFPVLGAYITAELINQVVVLFNSPLSSFDDFLHSGALLWIIYEMIYLISKAIIGYLYNAFVTISSEKVANHIKVKIITKSKEIDLSQFDQPAFYEKYENASREASFRPLQIINASFTTISSIISMISFIVVIVNIWVFAPLVVVLISLPAAIVKFVYGRRNFLYMRRTSIDRRQMEYYSMILTNKDLAKEVRIFDLNDEFIDKYNTSFGRYYKGLKGLVVRENVWHIIIGIGTAMVNAVLFAFVAYKVSKGEFDVGDYSFYSGSLNSIIGCVATIVNATATIYQGTLFIDNVIGFEKIETKIVPTESPALSVERNIPHTIEFRDVCFSYPGSDKLVVDHVSFTLDAGTTTVLVGLNGAGKTTVIKLLMRLYDPTSGIILLDGQDIRKYNLKELYDTYGTIFQDFGKYAVSAEENIYFGDINDIKDEDRMKNAAVSSGASDFIEPLPKQYKTSLMKFFDEDGTELSIGQWQKLSVARAFYSDSDILILDEPTASLDALAEHQIFMQFEKLTQGKTSVFVSHRLSSATTADKIIVLEHGRLIEEGTHKELMSKHGKYYELFSTQAKRYNEEN